MKLRVIILVLTASLIIQCQQKEAKKEFSFDKKAKPKQVLASNIKDLTNKGVGPIKSVTLSSEIDEKMAKKGKALYEQKCTACHKIGSTFIGPPPNGILERRSPEWVMNMIMNPEEMLKKDTLAKALFMEFNGQLMTNQRLDREGARAILEYMRTLD
ncbi:MAG: cytochrome c [Bacteroidota bacterium]